MKKLEELRISPAPWKVSPRDDTLVTTHDGFRVAIGCCERYDGGVGNAQLIAAAPELYECLREAVIEMCRDCPNCCGYPNYKCRNIGCECFPAKWRKVLARAAGEDEIK